jgi:hypothetical protein
MKETLNNHRHIILLEILKEKECIEARIGDFDIDYVLDEKTKVNIMIERTWKLLGEPAMISSLGGIGLIKEKMITLCGRLTQIYMSANGTLESCTHSLIQSNNPSLLLVEDPKNKKCSRYFLISVHFTAVLYSKGV